MTHNNQKLYRELSEPFASATVATAAVDAFVSGVEELRKLHKIPDVTVVLQYDYLATDSGIITSAMSGGFGDSLKQEGMLARALNQVQRDRQEFIGKILTDNVIKSRL